ncbi:MAG: hypothetical protein ABIP54_00155 [Candidatus Andersenbacteria bacterium]
MEKKGKGIMTISTNENLDAVLLYKVAERIKNGREMMGSKWQNTEAEVIAMQTIVACCSNHKKHGDALSWLGRSATVGRQVCGTDNSRGLQMLVTDGSIVIEQYKGSLRPSDNTSDDGGVPLVLRVTNSLLEYANSFIR